MRESREYARRSAETRGRERAVNRKYFLLFEGERTEQIYFRAVQENRALAGIHPLIEMHPVLRCFTERGSSNPWKMVQLFVAQANSDRVTYRDLIDAVCDVFHDRGLKYSQLELAVRKLYRYVEQVRGRGLDEAPADRERELRQMLAFLRRSFRLENLIPEIDRYLQLQNICFDPETDRICIVVDRDRKSFREDQYRKVLALCRQEGYGLYVSNPCFEFWLLLHYDESLSLDADLLLENPKRGRRTYAECALRELDPAFRKNRFDAKRYLLSLERAIRNEASFCEDPEELIDRLGSGVGVLLAEMREG